MTLSEPLSSATSTRPSIGRGTAVPGAGRDVMRADADRVGAVGKMLPTLAGRAA